MRILNHIEDLVSKQSPSQFARIVREGDKVFILQLGSNAHGSFLMLSELHKGKHKGSKVVPEGKMGSGWRGLGIHMRETIVPVRQAPSVSKKVSVRQSRWQGQW